MAKIPRKPYNIYLEETWDTMTQDGELRRERHLLGQTWAVSKAQAISFYRHREGMAKAWDSLDTGGDTSYTWAIVAEELKPRPWHYRPGFLEKTKEANDD